MEYHFALPLIVCTPYATFTSSPNTRSVHARRSSCYVDRHLWSIDTRLALRCTSIHPPIWRAWLVDMLASQPSISITHSIFLLIIIYSEGFDGDRNWNKGFEFSPDQKVGRPIDLIGRSETARKVLSSRTAEIVSPINMYVEICYILTHCCSPLFICLSRADHQLRPSLPPLFRLAKKWTLLYSLDQHGISLATFYSRVSPHCALGGCLLAVRDAEDQTFGVWMGDGIRKSASTGSGRGYYGSGESFLWKQESDDAAAQVFKWTGKNDYVALCESDYISFGGG